MRIGSEVLGRYVEGIDVSAELKNADSWLCHGLILLRLFGA
jgi:hypothetical protein